MEKIKNDFDEIAAFENEAIWNHNNHYHRLILGEIKPNAERIMEVGCGAGEFSRLVSARSNEVVGVDLSEKMLQKARRSPNHSPNISYLKGNYFTHTFPENHFDYIVSISTAHHFSLPGFIEKAERELKSGGKLIILDLFGEPNALTEKLSDLVAMPVSTILKFWHNGFIKASPEEHKVWEEHGKTDKYLTLDQVRNIAKENILNAKIQRHLFWRYSLIWKK